jgi:multiple sugar transport system substrate-binding protein
MSVSKSQLSRREFLRRTLTAAAATGGIAALSACAAPAAPVAPAAPAAEQPKATTAAEAPAAPAASTETTKVVWYNNADPVRNKWEEDMVKAYAEKDPTTKVDLMIVPWDEFEPKMAALIASGQPPDIWSEWGSSGMMDYYHRDMLLDQTDLIKRDTADLQLDQYDPKVIDLFTVEGKTYGIPMFNLHTSLYYNKKLFDEAGLPYPTTDWDDKSWTFDAAIELAKKLTVASEDPTKAVWGLNYGGYMADICGPWPWGKDLFGPDYGKEVYSTGLAKEVNCTDPDVVASYQWQQDLRYVHKVCPTPAVNQALSSLGGAFASGKLAMSVDGDWAWWVNKPITDFEWGVAAMPWGPVSNRNTMFTDPWFIAKGTPAPEKAWGFVKYLLSDIGLIGLITGLGCLPAKKTMMEPWVKLYPNMTSEDIIRVAEGGLKYGQESPNHRIFGYDQIDKTIKADLSKLWLGEVSAADLMPSMQEHLNAAIKSTAATK